MRLQGPGENGVTTPIPAFHMLRASGCVLFDINQIRPRRGRYR